MLPNDNISMSVGHVDPVSTVYCYRLNESMQHSVISF